MFERLLLFGVFVVINKDPRLNGNVVDYRLTPLSQTSRYPFEFAGTYYRVMTSETVILALVSNAMPDGYKTKAGRMFSNIRYTIKK